ncbi:FAD-dependent thymidylate synthase [Candidatus Dojkabacteria bacterium]|uniref:FAD-dependent thymidylate synthase n=1 Tax=Candidatus Dojkabacteria bacterium TaxID=2099670 RepID=A0A955I4J5_9BACT|nr:FAD-dependent thymidylate synthase [Candidatus Dojkabacteria bacterium]
MLQPTSQQSRLLPDIVPLGTFTEQDALGREKIWQTYADKATGRPAVGMLDTKSGVLISTFIPRGEFDTAAFEAWVGARHSRSAENTLAIAHEVARSGVDTGGKLRFFLGIGHTSPADMAKMGIGLDNIPMHLAMLLFLMSAEHAGQEKSTRFQGQFKEKLLDTLSHYLPENIDPEVMSQLEESYDRLGALALSSYLEAKDLVTRLFQDYYNVKDESGKRFSALMSRSLDCARVFLLLGQKTGMTFVASAREFSRIIALLKAYPGDYLPNFAHDLETFLAPGPQVQKVTGYSGDAAELIRHTEPESTFLQNLTSLKTLLLKKTTIKELIPRSKFGGVVKQNVSFLPYDYYPGERLAAQAILSLFPTIPPLTLLQWIRDLPPGLRKKIGARIFQEISPTRQLPRMAAATNMTLIFISSIAVARDLARHRGGGGRFEPIPIFNGVPTTYEMAKDLLNNGFILPVHLDADPKFAEVQRRFKQMFLKYYGELNGFLEQCHQALGDNVDYGFVLNLLPLGHCIPLWMHMNPAQANYLPELRVRPGGDNSYRVLAYRANEILSKSPDKILAGLKFPAGKKPDILSPEEFFDRS